MKAEHYLHDLLRFDSVSTRSNRSIVEYLQRFLIASGFETEQIDYRADNVTKSNVIGRLGSGVGGVAYFAHTDVVPADDWSPSDHGPFEPTVRNGRIYGRGSTDMKGSIACIMSVIDSLENTELQHPLYVCFSADEETGHQGIEQVIANSGIYSQLVAGDALGIVGEPTGMQPVYAHKGGVQIVVTSHGEAAHSSTRDGLNANLAMIPFLQEIKDLYDETETGKQWHDDRFDPPTVCMNIGINDHNSALNIKAAQSICTICFRAMPTTPVGDLMTRIADASHRHGLDVAVLAQNQPFFRDPKSLKISKCVDCTNFDHPKTVGFGSEACNLVAIKDLIVLGPGDIDQAHKSDEWVSIDQLVTGEEGYRRIINEFCC